MRYTQLGERGPQVSRIAFGNWSAGGDWGRVDRDAAIGATRAALGLGITLFDTAHAYGFGVAEELLGEALQPEIQTARESLVIATKGGLRNDHGLTVRDSSPPALRRDLESSLRALGTDYVDIYQVHWPDPATPIAVTAETVDDFVKEAVDDELLCRALGDAARHEIEQLFLLDLAARRTVGEKLREPSESRTGHSAHS